MNEAMFMKLQLELSKLQAMGIEVKDVLLMVNCRDIAGHIWGASNVIFVRENPFSMMTCEEKAVLLAEFVKKLGIEPSDLANFLRGQQI